jgi:enoyl-CoA hydratase
MTPSAFDTVRVEIDGAVGSLVLNRPERLNAINDRMLDESQRALEILERDDSVRVIVVKGEGRAFCVGYDLQRPTNERSTGKPLHLEYEWILDQGKRWERLWRIRKPTIAQVHGYAYAGGLTVMGFCDLVVVADNALIGQPEVRAQGFAPDLGLWHYTIGPRRTKELLFTGNAVTGREAESMGMVNYAVPETELAEHVSALARKISQMPPDMLSYAKRLVNQQFDLMGLHNSMSAGVGFDILAHHSPANDAFNENARTVGFKEAVRLRDEPFGGTQRTNNG